MSVHRTTSRNGPGGGTGLGHHDCSIEESPLPLDAVTHQICTLAAISA
jgi:hypothetical protein